MKIHIKQIIQSFIVIGVTLLLLLFVINAEKIIKADTFKWKNRSGNWYLYETKTGNMLTGWYKVGGKWYFMDNKTGVMKTGWIEDSDTWYYLGSEGDMQTGWKHLGDCWYYMDSTGAMQTGWQCLGGKWYFLNESGIMMTGWYLEDGTWFFLDSYGVMRTGWIRTGRKWYYLKSNGSMVTGLQWIGSNLCYFESDGMLRAGKKPANDSSLLVHICIPTYDQNKYGYPLGCEGVSMYMALRGLGYANNMSIHEFMATMPSGENPYLGYMGNPKLGRDGENTGKRTSIYPEPLSVWGSQFATVDNLTGASVEQLAEELKQGHVILIYATGGWKKPSWKTFEWSKDPKGEVTNNHCLCVVGVYKDGSFLVNDCGASPAEYKVPASTFSSVYNARKFAVAVH